MDRFIRSRRSVRSSLGRYNARRRTVRNVISRVARAGRMRRLYVGGEWARHHRAQIRRRNVLRFNRSRLPRTMSVYENPRLMDYIQDFNRPLAEQKYD